MYKKYKTRFSGKFKKRSHVPKGRRLQIYRNVNYKAPFGDMLSAKFKFVGVAQTAILGGSTLTILVNSQFNDPNQYLNLSMGGAINSEFTQWTIAPGARTWLNQFNSGRITGVKTKLLVDNLGSSAEGGGPEIVFTPFAAIEYGDVTQTPADFKASGLDIHRWCRYKIMTQPGSTGARKLVSHYMSVAQIIPDYVNRQGSMFYITPGYDPVTNLPLPAFTMQNAVAGSVDPTVAIGFGNMNGEDNAAGVATYLDIKCEFTVYFQVWGKQDNLLIP